MYYLDIISLKNCPYSEAANSLVKDNSIKSKVTIINSDVKEKYKTKGINTFPQVYLKKEHSSGSVLLGGYDNLKTYYDLVQQCKNKKETLDSIKIKIRDSNNEIADKSILRLIELMI
jgi:glutaredoxin